MKGTCTTCEQGSPELSRCGKCTALYCSRECQKTDWKIHKKICGKQEQGPEQLKPVLPLEKGLVIDKPFARLYNKTYLHGRAVEDVYRVLIDTYRMRVEEEYDYEGNAPLDTAHCIGIRDYIGKTTDRSKQYGGGAKSNLPGFRNFLRVAATQRGLLPSWWNTEKQTACETLAMDSSQWHDLRRIVGRDEIMDYYEDIQIPLQLRVLGLVVLGLGRETKMFAMAEAGTLDPPLTMSPRTTCSCAQPHFHRR